MTLPIIVVILLLLGLILYWQLVVTEGTYLGQRIVTWLYDLTAKRYESIKGFDRGVEATFLGVPLVRALQRNVGSSILDIGAGTGRLALAVFEQPTFQGRVISIDASFPMLLVASKTLKAYESRSTLICRDASRLPFEPESFDVVTCLEMLEFTPHPELQIREAFRVISPGGMMLVTRRRGFDAWLMPGKTQSHKIFEFMLSEVGFERIEPQVWQVDYDLYWAHKPGKPITQPKQLIELLCCTYCGARQLGSLGDKMVCQKCSSSYPLTDGILDMR